MQEELVSIIIPIYKVEQYLSTCIESVINQTYKNLEIILVDDGSPDNCGKICDEYAKKDDRIRVIHKENGGLSSARNAGLDVAKGEYISFIDSDDYVSSEFIKKLYLLCKNNNVDIAECSFTKFEDDTKIDINHTIDNPTLYNKIEMQELLYTEEHINTVVVWNKLYKRYIYEKLRFPVGKINEDEFTTYKAFNTCKSEIAVTNEPLYYYRFNESSIMGRKFNVKRFDVFEAYEERIEYYRTLKENQLYEDAVIRYQDVLIDYFILTKVFVDNPKEALNKVYNNAKENFEKYKEIKKLPFKKKLKTKIFIKIPYLYTDLILKKRDMGIKF